MVVEQRRVAGTISCKGELIDAAARRRSLPLNQKRVLYNVSSSWDHTQSARPGPGSAAKRAFCPKLTLPGCSEFYKLPVCFVESPGPAPEWRQGAYEL